MLRRNMVREKGKFFLSGVTGIESLEKSYLENKIPLQDGSYLIGDWTLQKSGYEVNPDGPEGFSAVVCPNEGVVVVQNSEWLLWCSEANALMPDGRECGNLDNPGKYGMAYSLPPDFYRE